MVIGIVITVAVQKIRFIIVYADGAAFLLAPCCSQVIKSVAGAAGGWFLLQGICAA